MRVHYEILNQKGTPAFYSDTYTNRPTYGFAGRVFISTDTGQIFEDTGSAWSLIADAGVGGGTLSSVCANGNTTATGIVITAGGLSSNSIINTGITAGSVLFAGTGGLESQSNATFFWDNTNKRLGIGNASPGAPLDIHGTGTQIQVNGTGSSNSYIQFQNAGVSKWRIGNTYSAGANSYGIYNNGLSSLALTINSTNNGIITTGYLNIENDLGSNQIYLAKLSSDTYGTIQTEAGGGKYSLGNVSNLGTLGTAVITWTSGLQVGINNISPTYDFDVTGTGRFTGILRLGSTLSNGTYFYTLPSATGTLALTSNLSSYLPLTGGTLTGQLYINPTNTATIGLDVASDNVRFRSDNLEGNKRQLLITMGSGTLVQLTAQGYGANYGTDLAFYTATTGGVNSSPAIYITGTNNRVGIKTGTPLFDLDVNGTGNFSSDVVLGGSSVTFGVTGSKFYIYPAFSTNLNLLQNYNGSAYTTEEHRASDYTYKIGTTAALTITSGGDVSIGSGLAAANSFNFYQNYSGGQLGFNFYNSSSQNVFGFNGNTQTINLKGLSGTGSRAVLADASGILSAPVSDISVKINILPIRYGLNEILQMQPVWFEYINEYKNYGEGRQNGNIAQQMADIIPEAVFTTELTGKMGINYDQLHAVYIKAIQELNEKLVRNNIN